MNKKISTFYSITIIALLTFIMLMMTTGFAIGDGAITYPWSSWRHDLLNTAAAPDFGYPTTANVLWKVDRSDRPDVTLKFNSKGYKLGRQQCITA